MNTIILGPEPVKSLSSNGRARGLREDEKVNEKQ